MRAGERGCRVWLRTVATRHRLDDARPGAHVVDNRSLEPRDHDVRSLTAHALLHAAKSVVHDSTVAALYVEEHVASTVGETGSAETGETKQFGQRSAATLRDLRGQAAQDLLEAPRHAADATRWMAVCGGGGDNQTNHHLESSEIQELSTLKFSAPLIYLVRAPVREHFFFWPGHLFRPDGGRGGHVSFGAAHSGAPPRRQTGGQRGDIH